MSESTQSTIINGYNMSKYIAASQQIKFGMGWPIAYITQDASEIHSQTQCKAKYNSFNGVLNELQCEKNIPSDMCAQQRLGSACAYAQSDQSLYCPHEETLHPWLY